MAHLVGRLRPGVTLDAATTEVRALAPQFGRLFPWRMPDSHGTDVSLRTRRESRLGEVRPTLLLLLGAVVAVWLIGTVNLTNLQQVRAAARRRELALRAALGAGRGRVARQLLTESSLLGLFGGAAGLAVAYAGVPALVALLPADVPRAEGIRVNGLVLCFAAVVSLGTALAAGTLPALRAARLGQTAAWAGLGGTVGGASGRRLGIFVTAEIAAAVMLVISAVLLARSLAVQVGVDVGFSGIVLSRRKLRRRPCVIPTTPSGSTSGFRSLAHGGRRRRGRALAGACERRHDVVRSPGAARWRHRRDDADRAVERRPDTGRGQSAGCGRLPGFRNAG